MKAIKLNDLPEGNSKDIILEAARLGSDLNTGLTDGYAVIILGMAQIIGDMWKEIEALKNGDIDEL